MSDELIFALIVIFVICAILSIVFMGISLSKRKSAIMQADILAVLESIRVIDPNNIKYEAIEKPKHQEALAYDYTLETNNYIYYIKVVPNFNNDEICVNNSVKWQTRRSYKDEHVRFVSNIDLLMRLDLENKNNKKARKLYIIYPNAKSLLKYINECELEFVHYNTDVYGAKIITYLDLKDHINLIEL